MRTDLHESPGRIPETEVLRYLSGTITCTLQHHLLTVASLDMAVQPPIKLRLRTTQCDINPFYLHWL